MKNFLLRERKNAIKKTTVETELDKKQSKIEKRWNDDCLKGQYTDVSTGTQH